MAMEGLGQKTGLESVHDHLFARVLSLCQGRTEALVISLDLVAELGLRIQGADPRCVTFALLMASPSYCHTCPRLQSASRLG
jgi:hypothetical protein